MDRYTNINKWGYELQQAYPKIEDTKIVFKPMHIYFEPWKNWEYEKKTTTDLKTGKKRTAVVLRKDKNNPQWWTAYNKVKHARALNNPGQEINFNLANQKNVLYAMAALYSIEFLALRDLGVGGADRSFAGKGELFSIKL